MNQGVMTRLMLARHLYELASQSLAIPSDLGLHSCVNLMQDAVEAFLVGVADHFDATLPSRSEFDKYFVSIDKVITPKQLPLKTKLLRLNKLRVSSKHDGILPPRAECESLVVTVQDFFDQVSTEYLGINFSTATPIDLLNDGDAKDFLLEAKTAKENGDLYSCVLSCRKALYVEIENEYDVSQFRIDAPKEHGLMAAFGPYSKAPYYARSDNYIKEQVKDASEFIVFDHDGIERSLLRNGVDPTMFWNVLRLTPPVWRDRVTKDWIVKRDLSLTADDALTDNADYVLQSAMVMLLSLHTKKRAVKSPRSRRFTVTFARPGIPVYSKADKQSALMGHTPTGVDTASAGFDIVGIADGEKYWSISIFEQDVYLSGYVLESDLVFSE